MECLENRVIKKQTDRIHVANGTLYLDGTFSEEKQACRNRLKVAYHTDAPQPENWLRFLDDLLELEDILTLQEFIKSMIVRSGLTMRQVVDVLSDEYGWSDSISNFSNKLSRGSLRYSEAIQIADVLGYEIVWKKRRDG